MDTSQFEAKKVALKQTKDGHVLTLAIHPDESPDEILRDFVGARYMVVMVRLDEEEKPLNREEYAGAQMVKLAGMLCRDKEFWEFLQEEGQLFETSEKECIEWMQNYLVVGSRSEIKNNLASQRALKDIYTEYKEWKTTRNT
jgi:hypothetical protein